MSWAITKKAINSTTGRRDFKALNEITQSQANDVEYGITDTLIKLIGDESGKIVLVPEGVQEIGTEYQSNTVIVKVLIPTTVESIAQEAFANCSSLESVLIPNSVNQIGPSAFINCSSLKSVILPSNIKKIDGLVFVGCANLKYVSIPEGVQEIQDFAFSACYSLKSITIPKSVKIFGKLIFSSCSSLTDIYVESSENEVSGAPWGAPNATVHYNS